MVQMKVLLTAASMAVQWAIPWADLKVALTVGQTAALTAGHLDLLKIVLTAVKKAPQLVVQKAAW
jgi:hypothetical protein